MTLNMKEEFFSEGIYIKLINYIVLIDFIELVILIKHIDSIFYIFFICQLSLPRTLSAIMPLALCIPDSPVDISSLLLPVC